MEEHTDNLAVVQWIAHCAERLREQWPRADPTSLEETAADLWRDPALRPLAPRCAAETWLGRGIPPSRGRRDAGATDTACLSSDDRVLART